MYKDELNVAIQAAKSAGEYLAQYKDVYTNSLSGKDIKLSSDKNSESILIDHLSKTDIPILSEEIGFIGNGNSNACWVIDPLDGTFNYYKGILDLCCVSIALCIDKKPVLGVVNKFASKELYYGALNTNAYLNHEKIQPSFVKKVKDAVIATGFPVQTNFTEENILKFAKKVIAFKKVRMLGTAALMISYVACGKVDAYIEEDIMLWDVAGAMAIAEAAGCKYFIEYRENNKCLFGCFANSSLLEDFYAQNI